MFRVIKTEFLKLRRYFILWIGVSLMLLTVLVTLFTSMAEDGMVWDFLFLYEQVIKNFATLIFPMCITLITGYMISREYTDDTLKNIVVIPISFRKLMAGKLVVSAVLSLIMGMVCFLFTVAGAFIMGYDGIYNRLDTLDFLSATALKTTMTNAFVFTNKVANATVFPFERKVSDEMKGKVDKYLKRKK